MSTENEDLVRRFLGGMGPTIEDIKNIYRTCLTDDVEWESVGSKVRYGLEASVHHLDELKEEVGLEYCEIDIRHIASTDSTVLTERVDSMYQSDGSLISHGIRLMGIFEIRDGKISRYTDYLDSLGVARALGRI